MSYEAAVAAAGGDESTMAKSFVIILRDIAQTWYSNLRPGTVDSWATLRDKLCTNFKGITPAPLNPIELFNCKQEEREPLQDYWRRFIQIRARTPGISDEAVILAAVSGLRPGPCSSKFARKPANSIEELHETMERYCRADMDFRAKSDARRSQQRPQPRPQPRESNPRQEQSNVGAINKATSYEHQTRDAHHPSSQAPQALPPPPNQRYQQRDPAKMYCHFCGMGKGHTTKQCECFAKGKEFQESGKTAMSDPRTINHTRKPSFHPPNPTYHYTPINYGLP